MLGDGHDVHLGDGACDWQTLASKLACEPVQFFGVRRAGDADVGDEWNVVPQVGIKDACVKPVMERDDPGGSFVWYQEHV